jgi:hypothetical protein
LVQQTDQCQAAEDSDTSEDPDTADSFYNLSFGKIFYLSKSSFSTDRFVSGECGQFGGQPNHERSQVASSSDSFHNQSFGKTKLYRIELCDTDSFVARNLVQFGRLTSQERSQDESSTDSFNNQSFGKKKLYSIELRDTDSYVARNLEQCNAQPEQCNEDYDSETSSEDTFNDSDFGKKVKVTKVIPLFQTDLFHRMTSSLKNSPTPGTIHHSVRNKLIKNEMFVKTATFHGNATSSQINQILSVMFITKTCTRTKN